MLLQLVTLLRSLVPHESEIIRALIQSLCRMHSIDDSQGGNPSSYRTLCGESRGLHVEHARNGPHYLINLRIGNSEGSQTDTTVPHGREEVAALIDHWELIITEVLALITSLGLQLTSQLLDQFL